MIKKIISISEANFSALTNKFKKFCLPEYQREYNWKEIHWKEFFSTILELMEVNLNKKNTMIEFIGDIILKETEIKQEQEENEQEEICEIIDGQQRLITITIFLSVIYKEMPDSERVRKQDIKDLLFYSEEEPRLTLNNKSDHKEFRRVLFKNISGEEIDEEALGETNINKMNQWFTDEISENDYPLTDLYDHIKTKLWFSLIIFSKGTEPWDVFMALNSTGLNLDASHLVKSLLVAKIDSKNTKVISSDWEEKIVNKVTGNDNTKINTQVTKFLVDFWRSRGQKVSKTSLYKNFEHKLGESNKEQKKQIFNDLKSAATVYEKIMYCAKWREWWQKNYSAEMFHIVCDIKTLNFEQLFPLLLSINVQLQKNKDSEETKQKKKQIIKELKNLLIYMFRKISLKGEFPRDIASKITYPLINKVKSGQTLLEFQKGNDDHKPYENLVLSIRKEFVWDDLRWKELNKQAHDLKAKLEDVEAEREKDAQKIQDLQKKLEKAEKELKKIQEREREKLYDLLKISPKIQNNNVRKFILKFYYFEKYLAIKDVSRTLHPEFPATINNYEAEHLISKVPRKKDKEKYEKFKQVKESIGNITLVPKEYNGQLSNKTWEELEGKREWFIKMGNKCLMNVCEEGDENLIRKEILETKDIEKRTERILKDLKEWKFLESQEINEKEENLVEI